MWPLGLLFNFKISETTGSEKFKFTWKLSDIRFPGVGVGVGWGHYKEENYLACIIQCIRKILSRIIWQEQLFIKVVI
jgi:hypothetical protein